MKKLIIVFLGATLCDAAAQTTLYWSGNGVTMGGPGNWNTTNASWNTAADGSGTFTTWNDANNDDAVFGGASAGTVNATSTRTARSLSFTTPGYVLVGNVNLAGGSGNISVSTDTATINATLGGSTGLTKNGAGTLVLGNSSNTFSGTILINDGVLSFDGTNGRLGAATNNITLNGGALQKTSGSNWNVAPRVVTVNNVSGNRFDVGGGNITFNGTNSLVGSGNVEKTGAAGLRITAGQSFSGNLIISQGTVEVRSSNNNLSNAGIMLNGGTLNFTESTSGTRTQVFQGLTLSSNSVINMNVSNTYNLAVSLADSSSLSWNGSAILSIWGWNPAQDSLRFGTSNTSLTASQLASFRFYSDAGSTLVGTGAELDSLGFISAIPEPSAMMLAGGAGVVLWLAGRRRRRAGG